MTREEAINQLKINKEDDTYVIDAEALDMAIKALGQEPCEDAISRQAVIRWVEAKWNPYGKSTLDFESGKRVLKYLKQMPSVTPQPKTGQWVEVTNGRGGHECDVCHDYAPSFQSGDEYLSPFCPNCGAKMVEPQESEG